MVPELRDHPVLLRALTLADAEAFAALNRDPLNVRWTNSNPHMTAAQARVEIGGAIADGWATGLTRRFGIVDLSTNALEGTTTFHGVLDAGASLGIKLSSEARGRGLARRAIALMLAYGFGDCGLEVIHWHAAVGNEASRKLAERSGFTLEGTIRGFSHAAGKRADGWILTQVAEEYRSHARTENRTQNRTQPAVQPLGPLPGQ